jgi:hypothetical protein
LCWFRLVLTNFTFLTIFGIVHCGNNRLNLFSSPEHFVCHFLSHFLWIEQFNGFQQISPAKMKQNSDEFFRQLESQKKKNSRIFLCMAMIITITWYDEGIWGSNRGLKCTTQTSISGWGVKHLPGKFFEEINIFINN